LFDGGALARPKVLPISSLDDSGHNQPDEDERKQAEQFDGHRIGFALRYRAELKIFF
jgi:hypothetical protein